MKKTHTLLLALFLCLALIFPCALAEDAYVSASRTQALIDAALDAGQDCRRRNAPDLPAWRRNSLHAGGRRGEPGAD